MRGPVVLMVISTLLSSPVFSEETAPKPAATMANPAQSRPAGVTSRHGMVTGTTGAAAIEAGAAVLREGGSAADASIATALTQVCMAAGSWVSYAGLMSVVYFDAKSGKTYDLNAGFNSVRGETDPASIPGFNVAELTTKGFGAATATPSGRTALVPGYFAGIDALHKRFGKLPLARLFEPAIRCAEDGVPWNAGLAAQYQFRAGVLSRLPETKAVFTKPDGSAYQVGDVFRQPALAATLRAIVAHGIREYVYTGPWAHKLVAAVAADGGKLSLEDLAGYQATWSEPVHTRYHGHDVYAHGMPADGGVSLVEALNLADAANVSKYGPYGSSPEALYWLAQTAKPAYLFAVANPDHGRIASELQLDLALGSRLQPAHAAKIWDAIREHRFPEIAPPAPTAPPVHSDGVVAIDAHGNMVAMVHSINTVSWGATGIFVDGISISDAASFQQAALAAIAPGARLPDPTNPGVVVKDRKPLLAFTSIGAGLHIRTIGALINVIDFNMTPQDAINEPSLGFWQLGAGGAVSALTVGTNDLTPEFRQSVAALGLPMIESDPLRGYWVGIRVDPKTHELQGGAIRELAVGARPVGY